MKEINTIKSLSKGIYVSSKPVEKSEYLWKRYKDAQHLYLIYMDGKGKI